jgi:hypothetical protein
LFIPSSAIADWRDLEHRVNALFQEMGYYTEVQKKVNLGNRGKKAIDVYKIFTPGERTPRGYRLRTNASSPQDFPPKTTCFRAEMMAYRE